MEPSTEEFAQELAITRVLHARLVADDCLRPGDRESVSYRVAEIMVESKNLYTDMLPRLLREPTREGPSVFEELVGLRMALLHLKDLVEDFEEAFLEAMANEHEADEEEED